MYSILIKYFTKNDDLVNYFQDNLSLIDCIKYIDMWVMNNGAKRNIYGIYIHKNNGICILSLNKNDFLN